MTALASVRPGERLAVVLIEQRAMNRRSLADWFHDHCEGVRVEAVGDLDELVARPPPVGEVDIVLFSIGAARVIDRRVLATIDGLKEAFADLPLVLLSDREEMEEVVEAIRRGARGFLPASLDLDEAVEALRFVGAGGTFVPARALIQFAEGRQAEPEDSSHQSGEQRFGRLTPREMEVLARLRHGKPNKVIAHELAISESTVKVFVRRILIKLRAINRTELVYLTNRRFGGTEPDLV